MSSQDYRDPQDTAIKDRRREPRIKTTTLVKGVHGEVADADSTDFLGTTVNLTPRGALLRTYQPFKRGDHLRLVMRLPDGDKQVSATVRHVRPAAEGCWHVGIEFLEISVELQDEIAGYTAQVALAQGLCGDPDENAIQVEGQRLP